MKVFSDFSDPKKWKPGSTTTLKKYRRESISATKSKVKSEEKGEKIESSFENLKKKFLQLVDKNKDLFEITLEAYKPLAFSN